MAGISRRGILLCGGVAAGAAVLGAGMIGFGKGGAIVPGVSRAKVVEGDHVLPGAVDVVVIGGGYIGCMTALTLAERGVSVALCEKGVIAGEASGRSLGWVDSQFLDPVKMELIGRSKELWAGMNGRVEGETGYRPLGLVSLMADQAGMDAAEGWLASVRGRPGVDARLVSAAEVAAMVPDSPQRWAGGLFQPSDASVEPQFAAPAMATAARRVGATILQHCAVRGIERSGGRISAVVTEKGRIQTSSVVLAGGVWSPLFARSLGLALPQFQAHASMMSLAPMEGPEVSAWGPGFTWRRQIDGGYCIATINGAVPVTPTTLRYLFKLLPAMRHMWKEVDPVFDARTFVDQLRTPSRWAMDEVSPFEKNRILQPEIRDGVLDEVLASLKGQFPLFQAARERERWGGVLVSTLDNMPVISPVASVPGLFFGTGFYYGLTMGPAGGEALADLVMGNRPRIDLSLYRYERFVDGSKLEFRS